jgi:hypothetical protein
MKRPARHLTYHPSLSPPRGRTWAPVLCHPCSLGLCLSQTRAGPGRARVRSPPLPLPASWASGLRCRLGLAAVSFSASLSPPRDVGKEGDGAAKLPPARTRGAMCLVATGVGLVRCGSAPGPGSPAPWSLHSGWRTDGSQDWPVLDPVERPVAVDPLVADCPTVPRVRSFVEFG